jgi:hypothetical protein
MLRQLQMLKIDTIMHEKCDPKKYASDLHPHHQRPKRQPVARLPDCATAA